MAPKTLPGWKQRLDALEPDLGVASKASEEATKFYDLSVPARQDSLSPDALHAIEAAARAHELLRERITGERYLWHRRLAHNLRMAELLGRCAPKILAAAAIEERPPT